MLAALPCLLAAAPTSQAAGPPGNAGGGPRPIFVLNSLDADVSLIDPVNFKEIRRIPTGREPHHLYLTPDEKSLIIANAVGNSLTFVDPNTGAVQRTLTGILDPYQLRFSPDMRWFVTAANRLNHVDLYRWNGQELTLAKRIPASRTPSHIIIDGKSTVAYISLQDSDELIAIDLATQATRWKAKVGKMPADVALSADDRRLFVGQTGEDVVTVLDVSKPLEPPKLLARIKTGAGAHAFRTRVVDGQRRQLFVSNREANTISLLDMDELRVVDTLPAPGGPDCIELLADGKTLLTTSRWARKLTFIDIEQKKVIRQIAVGRSPHGVYTLDHAPR